MAKKKKDEPQDFSYIRAAEMVFSRPLLIGETQGLIIGEYLSARMRGIETPEPKGNRFVGDEQFETTRNGGKGWKGYRKEGSTAIVSLMGETVNRGAWMGSYSGMTSYEGFSQQVKAADADQDIEHIVLDVNSPGGHTSGLAETSRLIRKIAKNKPVTAVVNAHAFSAAYILISGASRIVMTESAEAGSIGVLMVHMNRAAQLKEMGVKVTMFHAGERKVDLNPFEEVSEAAAQAALKRMNDIMAQAVGIVSEHRGVSAKSIYSLEAGILSAQASIDAGLADSIGTFDEVLANPKSADIGRTTLKRRQKMSVEITNTDESVAKAAHESAVAKAKTDGANEATTRFNSIMGNSEISGDAGRMKAAMNLANKSPGMSADDICAFVTDNVPKASASDASETTKNEVQATGNDSSLSNREQKPDSLAQVSGNAVGGSDEKQPKASGYAKDAMQKINSRRA